MVAKYFTPEDERFLDFEIDEKLEDEKQAEISHLIEQGLPADVAVDLIDMRSNTTWTLEKEEELLKNYLFYYY